MFIIAAMALGENELKQNALTEEEKIRRQRIINVELALGDFLQGVGQRIPTDGSMYHVFAGKDHQNVTRQIRVWYQGNGKTVVVRAHTDESVSRFALSNPFYSEQKRSVDPAIVITPESFFNQRVSLTEIPIPDLCLPNTRIGWDQGGSNLQANEDTLQTIESLAAILQSAKGTSISGQPDLRPGSGRGWNGGKTRR